MFGNLFEGEEEGFSSEASGRRVFKGTEVEPPPPRGALHLSGIRNQGGTCYLNSLIQTLLFTPEFREELFKLGPDELGDLAEKNNPEAKVRVIPLELQRLFAQLLLVDQQSASTADLTDSFGWTNNEESSQHDVQELNRILFSALESSLVGTSGSSLIHRLYHGTLVNQIVCRECASVSERQEDFLDLTVLVRGMCGLEGALWSMFVEEELFEGSNLYRCSSCDHLVQAAKSAKLRKLPPFLTMSLLRFNFDFAKCERYKETGCYTFPLSINLRPFCEQTSAPDSDYQYELFSVIIHKGGCYGGHYHVYVKDIDQLGHWEPAEEEGKTKTQKKEARVCEQSLETDDPLSLFKAILTQEKSTSVLVDQLGQRLMDKIGLSWNKKFRKQYGPIGKFLQDHPDVFLLVSNGTRVTLKVTSPAVSSATTPEESALSNAEADQNGHEGGVGRGTSDCSHWFDLNDSAVTAIRAADIEKQFGGKESAYMLFYRRTSLQRPSEAFGDAGYGVPPHLLQMANEENRKLQKKREEFETSSNSVEVRLHLAPHYQLIDCALHAVGDAASAVITVDFDRRKTVGDLRLAVYQMQELWEGDMALTAAKSLPAGLHLYQTLTDDQQSLYSAGVYTGSDLFVWNGKEVGGVAVHTGPEWEPVLLTVVRPSDDELEVPGGASAATDSLGMVRSMRGFASGATLGMVRQALGPEEALLCQETSQPGAGGGGASGWRVFPPQDMERTLRELQIRDGDALLLVEPHTVNSSIFSLSGDMVTVTTPSDCRWLLVNFREGEAEGGEEEEEEERRKKGRVPASGNMLLSEVKLKAIEELQLQEELKGVECCLRQIDRSGKLLPPVCEEVTVRDAGIRLMTCLSLCVGPAPNPNQLFLYFSVGTIPSAGTEMEIIVDKMLTVKECLKEMQRRVGLEGESLTEWGELLCSRMLCLSSLCTCVGEAWHLRRMDWCEEVGDALMDENATLPEAKVCHGDTLVLTPGQLPPKGYLKLSVWSYGDLQPELNHVLEGQEVVMEEWLGVELWHVGQVEISEEASLDDLKTQVMTLPSLEGIWLPTPAFLRVWLLERRKLGKILSGNQLSLRKLKVKTGSEVCVQRLLKEEDLGPRDLLLRVQMGVPGERQYYPWEELVWEAGCDSSPRSLRLTLASHYGLSPDNLLLAKRFPESHSWMPMSSWTQQVSKRKKKKKNDNLQGAPFYLKDGDIIGVKNLLVDSNRDFSTLDDELGLHKMREEEANHRKMCQSSGQESNQDTVRKAGPGRNRKPEVALSINVGMFR
ncbi:ubiquitin carboxyl-terminal hydrolase 40 isoform X2 [Denticeps clupeoides]|uniref:ubiquitin carboxyl-terminal hydrolase 40 isoform X2 n=1 Tax=Denticeps clupeoides TaxID=299321 RepID=UPI0010A3EC28|nr:ubiquitin carboxyl-terminal hydrolase 40 isoform X2 [Denticeps clupeoides]